MRLGASSYAGVFTALGFCRVRRTTGGMEFLDSFPAAIAVDLTPELDECYTLGPYTLFQNNIPQRTEWGDLLNRAKYQDDRNAAAQLGRQLEGWSFTTKRAGPRGLAAPRPENE